MVTIIDIVQIIILRFFDMGFLCFFVFLFFAALVVFGSVAALSSPLASSKSKTCVGLRKSSVILSVGFVVGVCDSVFLGVDVLVLVRADEGEVTLMALTGLTLDAGFLTVLVVV